MDSREDEAPVAPDVQPTGVGIDVEADATLGYASIQNSVPVVRSLRLTNHGTEALENLQVLITCNPRFAQGIKLRFDKLGPGETRRIAPIDLAPDHSFLADLQESVTAAVKVSVLSGTNELAHTAQTIEVLAYDQWAGTRALPELLADIRFAQWRCAHCSSAAAPARQLILATSVSRHRMGSQACSW